MSYHNLLGRQVRRLGGQVHTATLVELSSELPIVIIFVDRADRIARIMPQLTQMVQVGLISTTPVTVVKAGHRTPGPFPAHLTVADVMTRDVARVEPDTPVSEIVSLLIDRALRALPVVDADPRVVGMITDGDLLTRDVTDLSVDVQRALLIVDRAAAVATLTDRPQRAADVMTPNPITLPSTLPLAQAAAVMAERKLKRLPVVDEQGLLVGMVSSLSRSSVWRNREPAPAAIVVVQPPLVKGAPAIGQTSPVALG